MSGTTLLVQVLGYVFVFVLSGASFLSYFLAHGSRARLGQVEVLLMLGVDLAEVLSFVSGVVLGEVFEELFGRIEKWIFVLAFFVFVLKKRYCIKALVVFPLKFYCNGRESRKKKVKDMLDGVVTTKVAKYISDNEGKTKVCIKDASVTAIVNAMPDLVLKSTKSSICSHPAVQYMKSPRLSEHPAEVSPAKVFKLTWLPTVSLHPYYAHGDGMVPQVNVKASSVSAAPKVYRGSSHPRPLHTNYWVDYRPAKDRHMRQDDVWFLICYFDYEAWNLRRTKIKTMLDGVITTKLLLSQIMEIKKDGDQGYARWCGCDKGC